MSSLSKRERKDPKSLILFLIIVLAIAIGATILLLSVLSLDQLNEDYRAVVTRTHRSMRGISEEAIKDFNSIYNTITTNNSNIVSPIIPFVKLHNDFHDIKFNVKKKNETNSVIKDLERVHQAKHAMNVKFRSLVPGEIDYYWEDHRGGLKQGHLNLGQGQFPYQISDFIL